MADPTPQTILEEQIPSRMAANPALVKEIGAVVHFTIGENTWTLDCTGETGTVTAGAIGASKMTVICGEADFVKIATKALNANMAAMSGKLKFKPMDMALAMKLGKLIG